VTAIIKQANEPDREQRQRRLAAGVLKQAESDLRRFRLATSRDARELYLDAYCWLTADEFCWPFSFMNVCQTLGLVPEAVREEVLSDASLGTFAYWMRRCRRAVCHSQLSSTPFFWTARETSANDEVFSNPASNIAI
jgi:hypothetical protein